MKPNELFSYIKAAPYRTVGTDLDWCVEIDKKEKLIRVMFEESITKIDWFINFCFPVVLTIIGGMPYLLSLGWWISWCSGKKLIMNKIMSAMNDYPDYKVEINGFSYGGAISQICGIEVYEATGIKPDIVTFGSPKPLFGLITKFLARRCFNNITQYAHRSDLVTYCIPLPFYFDLKNKRIGKFSFKNLIHPEIYHQIYDDEILY